MKKLYLGAENSEWDYLSELAEELLFTEVYDGQQILGIYPFGGRIFGFETEAPSIICLYLRDLSTVLNPLLNSMTSRDLNNKPVKEFTVNNGGGKIIFIDIYHWVGAIQDGLLMYSDPLMYLVPAKFDIIHQDDSISEIVESVADYMKKTVIKPYRINSGKGLISLAQKRAVVIHSVTGIFNPCLNKKWDNPVKLGKLIDCSKTIATRDEIIIDTVTRGDYDIRQDYLDEYVLFLFRVLIEHNESSKGYEASRARSECGDKMEKLLRRLL